MGLSRVPVQHVQHRVRTPAAAQPIHQHAGGEKADDQLHVRGKRIICLASSALETGMEYVIDPPPLK
jgi:hypothetical protein